MKPVRHVGWLQFIGDNLAVKRECGDDLSAGEQISLGASGEFNVHSEQVGLFG